MGMFSFVTHRLRTASIEKLMSEVTKKGTDYAEQLGMLNIQMEY